MKNPRRPIDRIPGDIYVSVYFFTLARMTNRVPIIRAIAMGREMNHVWMFGSRMLTKAAMRNETNETAATVIAYGSWVET